MTRPPGRVGVPAQRERDRDQQPADHHERDHVADPVHQRLVPDAPLLAAARPRHGRSGARHVHRRRPHLLDQPLGMVDPLGHPDGENPLAGETAEVHVLVRGDDDAVRVSDIVVVQDVFSPDRSLGLHLHVDAPARGGLRELLRGHVRVRDAGRARGHGQQLHPLPLAVAARGGRSGWTGHVDLLTPLSRGDAVPSAPQDRSAVLTAVHPPAPAQAAQGQKPPDDLARCHQIRTGPRARPHPATFPPSPCDRPDVCGGGLGCPGRPV
ncbi:hypothetical protein M2162_004966 [Streptomyces sp. SAI-041]|nr:hypothetical protein [Streptomyces sp. SAI-041]